MQSDDKEKALKKLRNDLIPKDVEELKTGYMVHVEDIRIRESYIGSPLMMGNRR